jgi:hypothetical protein
MIIPAKYTEVLDNLLNNEEAKQAIDEAMASYPLYEQEEKARQFGTAYHVPTRKELNNKILNYYRFREIGFETFGRFIFELKTALEEIMPKYNQLFYSADQDFNPIYNVDYEKIIGRDRTDSTISNSANTSTDETEAKTNTKDVASGTPQSELLLKGTADIDSVNYADSASWNENLDNNKTTSNMAGNSTTDGSETELTKESTKGNFGVVSAQDLILKYRETILNIEQMIINDPRIQECFMLIY